MDDLLADVRQGERRAVARTITQVERSEARAREIVKTLYPYTGQAHVVGITGAPGTGKSTLVNELAKALRERELQVGIVAVDPSSPFTGGALLGDRIRMRDLSGDPGIFIRSMAARGSLGGLARATAAVVKILDAAGFDVVLIETVGAGQAEVDIAHTAHTVLVVEAPGMGDDIQSIKAGILEIADLLIVNKADRSGARATVTALKTMLHMGAASAPVGGEQVTDESEVWNVDVYETVATTGEGVDAVVDALLAHHDHLRASGRWQERERNRSRQEIEQLLQARLMERLRAIVPPAERERLIADVAERKVDPYTAVDDLFQQIAPGVQSSMFFDP